jgi:hypothetical protein
MFLCNTLAFFLGYDGVGNVIQGGELLEVSSSILGLAELC